MQRDKWISVQELLPQIIADYAAARAPADQREKDMRDYEAYDAQPEEEGDEQ